MKIIALLNVLSDRRRNGYMAIALMIEMGLQVARRWCSKGRTFSIPESVSTYET